MSIEAINSVSPPDKQIKGQSNKYLFEHLIPYAIAGAIFYQGEGGSGVNRYDVCLEAMVKDWRAKWGQGDFPFINVQVSGSTKFRDQPKPGTALGSPNVARDVQMCQFAGLAIPNSGLATAADRGVSQFCELGRHPKNKRELGRRLALIARSMVYGDKTAVGTPLPESMTVEGATARLKFNNVGDGLKALGNDKGEVVGFAASAADGKNCRWASAKIVGKDTVEIAAPGLAKIERIFYAPDDELMSCNLYNGADIAAPIFAVDEKWFAERAAAAAGAKAREPAKAP
jgi:sialate O-acetylesterase